MARGIYIRTPEARRNNSLAKLGTHHTKETRARISAAMRGKRNHATPHPVDCSHCIKLRSTPSPCRGIPRPSVWGANSASWRGGLTELNKTIRASAEYKAWRRHVFARDDH